MKAGMQWFRMYAEFATDPVAQSLSFDDQRHFVIMLCMKCAGVLDREYGSAAARVLVIRRALGLDAVAFDEVKRRLREARLIDNNWHPTNWGKRQYLSDSSTPRVRAFRERKGNVSSPLHVTDVSVSVSDSASDSGSEQKKSPIEQLVADLRSIYPRRAGSQPWDLAAKAINARLVSGHTPSEILDGARRYAAFIRATGKEGTEYVLQASTFCGPSKRFLEPWTPPASKADARLASNISAAQEAEHRLFGGPDET